MSLFAHGVAAILSIDQAKCRPQKQQQQKDANAEGAGPKKKKVTAAQLRVQKGMPNPTKPVVLSMR